MEYNHKVKDHLNLEFISIEYLLTTWFSSTELYQITKAPEKQCNGYRGVDGIRNSF